ncbi:conserved hypothetical protein [Trichinella spiralis]|uniref:hypothetical protein n=1 Tax=Trichinella spiralis TaxID=6334 RepID=UPI0001EFD7D2|nr:conserved hypothetical protein [Trichinella spiralis]
MFQLGAEKYVANEWKLFIDSAKKSLKGVIPHNGNTYVSVPTSSRNYFILCTIKLCTPFYVLFYTEYCIIQYVDSHVHIAKELHTLTTDARCNEKISNQKEKSIMNTFAKFSLDGCGEAGLGKKGINSGTMA